MEVVNSREHTAGSTDVDNKGRKRKGSNRAIASDDDDNYVGRKSKSDEEDEEDVRMVEESLSDIQHPRPPQEPTWNQEENMPASPFQAQSPPQIRQDTGQASRSRAVSAAGSGSLSGRETKSISPPISRSEEAGSPSPSATSPTRNVTPTTPLRNGSIVKGEEHDHRSPILSPRAKKRLEIFDREIEFKQLDDGDKAKKSRVSKMDEGKGGEMVIAEGGRQEHGFQPTSEEKSWNEKDKEQRKEDKARTSAPKVQKRKDESSDASDSQDRPDLGPKESVGSEESQGVEAEFVVERREEEESTQDLALELLLHQRQQGVGVERGWALVPEIINDTGDLLPAIQIDSQPISEAILDIDVQNSGEGNIEKSDRFLDEIPSVSIIFVSYQSSFVNALFQIIVENPSRSSLTRSYSSLEDGDGQANRKTGSRTFKSRSRSHSASSQRNKNDESDPDAIIPPTASTHRENLQESSQPVSQVNIFRSFLSTQPFAY